MPTHSSSCPLDCPDACSLEIETDGARVTHVRAGPRNPLTAGFLCAKVAQGLRDHVHGDHRVATPLMRDGPKGSGRFRPISWSDALSRVAHELHAVRSTSGAEAILPVSYGGSNGWLTHDAADALFFRRLGASRLLRTVCAAPSGAAQVGLYGGMNGIALDDLEHAQLLVLWGLNPHASGIHLVPVLKRAKARGATLVVIDPRRTAAAGMADLHLAPRPGTDLVLALAMHRWLFEQKRAGMAFLAEHAVEVDAFRSRVEPWTIERACAEADVAPADLLKLVESYANASPAAIRCGWGVERNRNGGSAVAAILALPAVAGKFGVRAGGYTMSNGRAFPRKLDTYIGAPEAPTRAINLSQLGHALESAEPAVRAIVVYDMNPLATCPDSESVRRGLAREDLFTVVFDAVMTDTAAYADIVLPATTFLEHEELHRGYGAYMLQHRPAAIPPQGEARTNTSVFRELLERMDLAQPGDPANEADWVARAHGQLDATQRASLREGGTALPARGDHPVQFVDLLPGGDGKIHLLPFALDHAGQMYRYQPDPGPPGSLALISPATTKTTSSTFGQLHRDQVPIELHPDDAAARGLADGVAVRVWNDLGEVHTTARLQPTLRPGVAMLPKGLWSHHTANGRTATALVPQTLSDLGAGACYNDARVFVAPR